MDMAPPYQVRGILQANENYVRLKTLMLFSEMDLYYKIFHEKTYGGFSTNPQELYAELQKHNMEIQALLNQKLITKEDYNLIFPPSHETYSQEFSVDLFYALAKQCVKKFPPLLTCSGDSVNSSFAYLNEMEKLQGFGKNKKTQESVNSSPEEFYKCWNEIITILKNLGYDVSKVNELRDNYMDDNKKFRFAWIRAQVNLLSNACKDLSKTAELNTFAINKLLLNFNAAISESKEDPSKPTEAGSTDGGSVKGDASNHMNTLKKKVYSTAEKLSIVMKDIELLKPQMKCWREKNIEGDIIVIDELLSQLKNEVNEQSWTVGEMFNSVSLDIVKIKERMSFHGNDTSKFIVSPDHKRDRSDSRSERKRDSKSTDV